MKELEKKIDFLLGKIKATDIVIAEILEERKNEVEIMANEIVQSIPEEISDKGKFLLYMYLQILIDDLYLLKKHLENLRDKNVLVDEPKVSDALTMYGYFTAFLQLLFTNFKDVNVLEMATKYVENAGFDPVNFVELYDEFMSYEFIFSSKVEEMMKTLGISQLPGYRAITHLAFLKAILSVMEDAYKFVGTFFYMCERFCIFDFCTDIKLAREFKEVIDEAKIRTIQGAYTILKNKPKNKA